MPSVSQWMPQLKCEMILLSANLTTSQKENINFILIVGKVYIIASSISVTESIIQNLRS